MHSYVAMQKTVLYDETQMSTCAIYIVSDIGMGQAQKSQARARA